ncbi:MAG: hypothetical protein RLZZ631_527 [Cyanobacteriota bacterium]|jgi:hypothetical protein
MAVASPYAVFRAADLAWPAAAPLAAGPVVIDRSLAAPPRKRAIRGSAFVTLTQGELFAEWPAGV